MFCFLKEKIIHCFPWLDVQAFGAGLVLLRVRWRDRVQESWPGSRGAGICPLPRELFLAEVAR